MGKVEVSEWARQLTDLYFAAALEGQQSNQPTVGHMNQVNSHVTIEA